MLNRYYIFICLSVMMLLSSASYSQDIKTAKSHSITPLKKDKGPSYTRWSLKAGANLSVIYLARNTKEKNNEPGYCGG